MHHAGAIVLHGSSGEDALAVAETCQDAVAGAGTWPAEYTASGKARCSCGAVDHFLRTFEVGGVRRNQGDLDLHVLPPFFGKLQHALAGLLFRFGVGDESDADSLQGFGLL
ncbi:hypothetical protein D9M69_731680 [compost metagenome]